MKKLHIKTIRIDGGTQSRVEINNELVHDYAQAIESGVDFPPVVVFNDGADNWLADGFHRFHAHGMAGKTSIAADVRTGTLRDAILFSLGANGRHGKPPSNEDKRKIVLTLLNDAEWGQWSDNAIAKEVHVAHSFVGRMRLSLVSESSENVTDRVYKTKHGTTAVMKTDAIGNPIRVEVNGVVMAIPAPVIDVAPAIAPEPEYTPLDAAQDQIAELQDQLAATIIGGASEDDKENAQTLIADLRLRIKTLEATLKAVTLSRDTYMNENAELRKQITRQRREIDKATGKRTA